MLVNLMTRFPESAQPFLDNLLGTTSARTPDLSTPQAEAVCRILLDMPDVRTWRKSALQILPHYRRIAESLLAQDLNGSDREKSYRARVWLADLKVDPAGNANEQQVPRKKPAGPRSVVNDSIPRPAVNDSIPSGDQAASITASRVASDRTPATPVANTEPARPPPPPAPAPSAPLAYNGPRSGTLESSGNAIPQNAEYVFRNVPPVKMQLDYDTKIWDARLAPGDGQTQKLIVRNKSSGPQKRCVVRWTVIP
jgi:hypothetical protein